MNSCRHRHQQQPPEKEEQRDSQRRKHYGQYVCDEGIPHGAHRCFPSRPYFLFSSLVSRFNLRDSSMSEYVDGRGLPYKFVPATNPITAETNFSDGLLPRGFMGVPFWIVKIPLQYLLQKRNTLRRTEASARERIGERVKYSEKDAGRKWLDRISRGTAAVSGAPTMGTAYSE